MRAIKQLLVLLILTNIALLDPEIKNIKTGYEIAYGNISKTLTTYLDQIIYQLLDFNSKLLNIQKGEPIDNRDTYKVVIRLENLEGTDIWFIGFILGVKQDNAKQLFVIKSVYSKTEKEVNDFIQLTKKEPEENSKTEKEQKNRLLESADNSNWSTRANEGGIVTPALNQQILKLIEEQRLIEQLNSQMFNNNGNRIDVKIPVANGSRLLEGYNDTDFDDYAAPLDMDFFPQSSIYRGDDTSDQQEDEDALYITGYSDGIEDHMDYNRVSDFLNTSISQQSNDNDFYGTGVAQLNVGAALNG